MEKKLIPFFRLRDLPGVEREIVDSCLIFNTENIGIILEEGYACSANGESGAFDIYKDDTGSYRGIRMYCRLTMEERIFSDYEEMIECVKEWFEIINMEDD